MQYNNNVINKVSVIIPTYKRYKNISKIVENVLCQDYPNYEVIIIDDNGIGSSYQKNTFKSIERLLKQYNNLRYIAHDVNSGACIARNTGIKEAKGDYVAFLDDDDYWHHSFLTNMMSTILKERVDIAYSNFYRIDESGIFYNRKEKLYSGMIRTQLLNGWCPATTSLFFIKKSLLLSNGGFDENMKNLEEYDLWIRLSENNIFACCEKRLVLKSESNHEQLTNNYDSRIIAWKELKKIWDTRNLKLSEKNIFFNIIDANIKTDLYHKDLQQIAHISIPNKSKYGIKRTCLLSIAKFFGSSFVIKFKHYLSRNLGIICYLSKSRELRIKKQFNVR